jgi:putative ABC transport system permease protein
MPDVIWADRLILTWGFLKLGSGGQEQVQIIGFNPDTGVGAPWKMVSGSRSDVKGGRYMIIDRTSEKRLGGLQPGSVWELNQVQFKLAGLSEGTRSFTTAPVVFIGYNQVHRYLTHFVRDDQATYIVAKLRDPKKTEETVRALREVMKDNDILSKKDFIKKTVLYWTVQTGMGMGFFLTALLGLIVGGAIVGQTVYANTMEHLREFGTLKALGARNSDIYAVIFSQVGINAVIGFFIGSILIISLQGSVEKAGVSLYLHPLLFMSLFLVVLLTCLLSAFFSVRKVRSLDPVTVFRS